MKLQGSKKLQDKKEIKKLACLSAKVIEEKKLEDIVVLELEEGTGIADYFIIATASSNPQMKSGIDAVYKAFKDEGIHPYGSSESSMDSLWSLIDYGFLVVHIFTKEGREFYELDKRWHECEKIDFHNDNFEIKKSETRVKKDKNNQEKSNKENIKIKKDIKSKIDKKEKIKKTLLKNKISKKSVLKDKKIVSKKETDQKTSGKKSSAKKTISKKSLAKKTIKKLSKKTFSNKK